MSGWMDMGCSELRWLHIGMACAVQSLRRIARGPASFPRLLLQIPSWESVDRGCPSLLCRRTVLSILSSQECSFLQHPTIFQHPPIHPYRSSEAAPCPKQQSPGLHDGIPIKWLQSRHSQPAFPATTFANASSAALRTFSCPSGS